MVAPLITLSFGEHCLHSTSGRPYFSNFSAHSLSFLWSLNVEWPGFQSQTPSLLNLHSFFGGLICFMSLNPIYLLRTLKGILPVRTSLILVLHVHSCLCCISSWKSDRRLNLKWVESKPWYSLWHLLHPQFFFHLSSWQHHPCSCSGQKPWSHIWLHYFFPDLTSNTAARLVGSAFGIYLDSDHFS